MDIEKVNEFNFLNEEVEVFTNRRRSLPWLLEAKSLGILFMRHKQTICCQSE